tara:strand:- start:1878 stop:3797 length:1920 start_codon:yes stop_codon:yes gene_type:complete
LTADVKVTIEDLGGEGGLLASQASLQESPFLPEVIQTLPSIWSTATRKPELQRFVASGLEKNRWPDALARALEALFASQEILSEVAGPVERALLARASKRGTAKSALLAGLALEGVLRLAIGSYVPRYRLLAVLTEVTAEEEEHFAVRVARLLGVAIERWGDPEDDLLLALERLAELPCAVADAAFESGMVRLSIALQSTTRGGVIEGLRGARQRFAASAAAEPERVDAVAYGAVIDSLLAFEGGRTAGEIRGFLEVLERAVRVRATWLHGLELSSWLQPRIEAEFEWLKLVRELQGVAENLNRKSWLHAGRVLRQTLNVYEASRSVSVLQALSGGVEILEPRIEAAFVRELGLLAHLDDWLRSDVCEGQLAEAGERLRERITERVEGGTPLGKDGAATSSESLVAVLGADFANVPDELGDRILRFIHDTRASQARSNSPLVNEILKELFSGLESCSDFSGRVRQTFEDLIVLSLRFLRDRQDLGRATGGPRCRYLFAWGDDEAPPLEADLQSDYRDFLMGSPYGEFSKVEARDHAGGRVDVAISFETHRFVAELKRELVSSSREGLRRYLGQASLYQGTDVRLGLLIVLDLTDKSTGVPHFRDNVWLEEIGGPSPRFVVVLRVQGNRIRPSRTLAPGP